MAGYISPSFCTYKSACHEDGKVTTTCYPSPYLVPGAIPEKPYLAIGIALPKQSNCGEYFGS